MAAKNGNTQSMFDEQGSPSIAVAGVQREDGDLLFPELMGENFLRYAMSVLTDRALPDIRDGLLPVQRRILLGMNDLRLRSNVKHRKSAKVVGEVMGNYHPHGDLAIYGALVRMAQDFSLRVPLVDGHGNFGNLDGDGAAASRYTECRLSPTAEQVLGGKTRVGDRDIDALDPEVLGADYGRNYDESRPEPKVLPASYPNLLVNGNMGIAVGMTCTMLPHNPGEVLDLAIWRLANPDAPIEKLVARLSGPDFPTGALVVKDDGLRQSYLTGEGKVTSIGEAHIEPTAGNRERIIITSLPYGVAKGSGKGTGLLEVIAKQHAEGKYPEVTEMNDESTSDTRIVIELKRGSNAQAVLARLYKYTRLRNTYGVAMNVLVEGRPTTVNLADLIDHFLNFRRHILVQAANKRLREIEVRLHKLEAFLKAIDAIDAVVKTIRGSSNRADAKPKLMKLLKIDEQQATWIVEMPLGNLTSLETKELKEEQKRLVEESKFLKKFMSTPAMVSEQMAADFKELKKAMASPRQTKIVESDGSAGASDAALSTDFSVPAEECVLLMSAKGQAVCGQGSLKRGAGLDLAAGDRLVVAADARSDEEWVIFTSTGKAYRLRLAELPLANKRSKGQSLTELLPLTEDDRIVAAYKFDKEKAGSYVFVYGSGMVKKTLASEFASVHSSGIVAAKPNPGDSVVAVHDCPDGSHIILVGSHGKGIRFAADDLRPMGRNAAGVRGINLPDTAELVGDGIAPADDKGELLMLTDTRFAKRIPLNDFPSQGRGGGGVALMKTGGKYGEPAHVAITTDELTVWLQKSGKLADYPATKIPKAGRAIVPKPFDPADGVEALLVRREEA